MPQVWAALCGSWAGVCRAVGWAGGCEGMQGAVKRHTGLRRDTGSEDGDRGQGGGASPVAGPSEGSGSGVLLAKHPVGTEPGGRPPALLCPLSLWWATRGGELQQHVSLE